MSTLVVSNINDGTTTVPATYVTNGSAKAWVNFNGTGTIAIRDSLNFSSLTDGGTGKQTITLTNAMSDGNYSGVTGGHRYAAQATFNSQHLFTNFFTTTSLNVQTNNSAGSAEDWELVNATIHGDLA